MKTLITILGTLVVMLAIISPFFWLRFLYGKNRKLYIFYATLATVGIFYIYVFWLNRPILGIFAKMDNSDFYYVYDDASFNAMMLFHLLVVLYPFIFTKILYGRFKIKSFFISLFLSITLFILYALVFVFILVPMAFEGLNKSL